MVEERGEDPFEAIFESLRSLKRWVALATALALLATALAAYAVLRDDGADRDPASRARTAELDNRLDLLEREARKKSEESDVASLRRDLRSKAAAGDVRALRKRLDAIAEQQEEAGAQRRQEGARFDAVDERLEALSRQVEELEQESR